MQGCEQADHTLNALSSTSIPWNCRVTKRMCRETWHPSTLQHLCSDLDEMQQLQPAFECKKWLRSSWTKLYIKNLELNWKNVNILFLIADFLWEAFFNQFRVLHMPHFLWVIWGSMSGTVNNALSLFPYRYCCFVMTGNVSNQSISQNVLCAPRYHVSFLVGWEILQAVELLLML